MSKKLLIAGRPSQSSESKPETLANLIKKKRINFDVSEAEHQKLKTYAVMQNKTITEVLTEYIHTLEV